MKEIKLTFLLRVIKIINTFFPIPIKLNKKQIISSGRGVFSIDTRVWEKDDTMKSDWYIELDEPAKFLLQRVTYFAYDKNSKIIDICCNIGRHLNFLSEKGYKNLYGFDIMGPAIDKMSKVFPKINMKNITHGNIVDILPGMQSESIDWAYTHSATIELVHPYFKIHKEMFRLVKKGCIFLISDNGHRYPRYYQYLFEKAGFITLRKEKYLSNKFNLSLYVWIKPSYLKEFKKIQLS